MVDDKIVGIKGNAGAYEVRHLLATEFGHVLNEFESKGQGVPTGAIWVIFDDKAAFRVGWNTDRSALPAGACLGLAITGIMRVLQDTACPHD